MQLRRRQSLHEIALMATGLASAAGEFGVFDH